VSEVPIPPASLERLRMAYGQFTQLVQVVAEALELGQIDGIDLPRGVLIVKDAETSHNGVAQEAVV
jgi:hypothetical protein